MADLWLPSEHDVEVTIQNGKVWVSETVKMNQRPVGHSVGFQIDEPQVKEVAAVLSRAASRYQARSRSGRY